MYSAEHLTEILAVAEKHFLPIIADEIYDFFVSTFLEVLAPRMRNYIEKMIQRSYYDL